MPVVGIIRTDLTDIDEKIETLLSSVNYHPSKEKVVLKPNIVVAEPPENGSITHPRLIQGLIRYFRRRNREVAIAEGTGIFADDQGFERLLRATGYDRLRDELGVPIINVEKAETEEISWRYGTIELPVFLKNHEYINVPTMKTHAQTMVTLGVKNQKGLLPMKMKKLFHKKDLHGCIHALSEILQPSLTVVDAIYCVEGAGPTGPPVGEVKKMDLMVAGRDMMAVDNVCASIMGFEVESIKHLTRVDDIEIAGDSLADVRTRFKSPGSVPFAIDNFTVHADDKACTMCTVTFYKALTKIFSTPELREQLRTREDLKEIHFIMGQADLPEGLKGCTICMGDCSTKTARQRGVPQVKGCHPDYREIVNLLFPGQYPELLVVSK
jgi:uncharacterized protein (DUF362 family)